MVNPQPTDPHMRIENHIWETLAKADLSGAEFRVLLTIIRLTWGWGKKARPISQAELAEATGISHHSYLTRITNALAQRHFIAKASVWGKPTTYQFNKHYDEWTIALTGSTDAPCSTDQEYIGSTNAPCNGSTDSPCNSLGPDTLLHESNIKTKESKSLPSDDDHELLKHPLVLEYRQLWRNGGSIPTNLKPSTVQAMVELTDCPDYSSEEAITILRKIREHERRFDDKPLPYVITRIVDCLRTGTMPAPKTAKGAGVNTRLVIAQ